MLATSSVRLKPGSTSCTAPIHSADAHSTVDCCSIRMRRCGGAACALTIFRIAAGVSSGSPRRALRMKPGVSMIVRLAQ